MLKAAAVYSGSQSDVHAANPRVLPGVGRRAIIAALAAGAAVTAVTAPARAVSPSWEMAVAAFRAAHARHEAAERAACDAHTRFHAELPPKPRDRGAMVFTAERGAIAPETAWREMIDFNQRQQEAWQAINDSLVRRHDLARLEAIAEAAHADRCREFDALVALPVATIAELAEKVQIIRAEWQGDILTAQAAWIEADLARLGFAS